MSTHTIPDGYTVRSPNRADAEAIQELVAAYNIPIVGFADCTVDDVRDELAEPGWDPERDGWLAFDGAERLVGYGWAHARDGSDEIPFDVIATDPVAAEWLLDRSCDRAREMGRAQGFDAVKVDKGIYREEVSMRSRLEARGFAAVTTFQRMRIDHDGPVPTPEPPAGLTIREATDDDTRRVAYEVDKAAFADHFGFVPKRYDEWIELREVKSTFDWPQLVVAELDGQPVAICECNDQFVEDDDCGYVSVLGTLPEARGRGVATYLLRRSFAADAAAGRAGTVLHVDSNNTTPAVGLYESVGMRSVLIVDVWRRTLSVG